MNRRNFVGLLAASAVAAITPVRGFLAKKWEFSGETIPSGNVLCIGIDSADDGTPIPLTSADMRYLQQCLVSRDVQPYMRVRFQGTLNPVRLTHVERVA